MFRSDITVSRLLTLSALALLIPLAGLQAQERWNWEASGGLAFPAGDLAEFTDDAGASMATSVGYEVTPRIALEANGGVDILSGEDFTETTLPDLRLWHYGAGVDVAVYDPEPQGFTVRADVGGGATTIDSDTFLDASDTMVDFTETYFTANGGIEVGYEFTPGFNAYLNGDAYLIVADEEDTQMLSQMAPELEPFDTAWTVPVRAGLEIEL